MSVHFLSFPSTYLRHQPLLFSSDGDDEGVDGTVPKPRDGAGPCKGKGKRDGGGVEWS